MRFAKSARYFSALAALATLVCASAAQAGGDAAHGEILYEGCQDCHSLDKNDVGPRHRGVFGRKAGSLPDFAYSDALVGKSDVWTGRRIVHFAVSPGDSYAGTSMKPVSLPPDDRRDLENYLEIRGR